MLVFAVYYFCANPSRILVSCALAPVFLFAAFKAAADIGCSERYRAVERIAPGLHGASTEICIFTLACTAVATWTFGRVAAMISTALIGMMVVLLYWPPSDLVSPYAYTVKALLPTQIIDLVGRTFAVAVLLVNIGFAWRHSPARTAAGRAAAALSFVLLLVPFRTKACPRGGLYGGLSTYPKLCWFVSMSDLSERPGFSCNLHMLQRLGCHTARNG
jgi:hypothetical protein